MPTPDLSAPGTTPYHDPYDADGHPLPPQPYNGSKDVHGRPICAPAPILPGNGGEEIAGSPWLTDPDHPLHPDHPDNAPTPDPTPETPVTP